MQSLRPALEAAGFFHFCLIEPKSGLRDLRILTNFLLSRKYKDDALLSDIGDTLKMWTLMEGCHAAKPVDVSRLLFEMASLGARPDNTAIEFFLEYFRDLVKCQAMREAYFRFHLMVFLRGAFLCGVYPHDLIDAFFSEEFMRLEDGRLPGLGVIVPWTELLRLDCLIDAMCPDYKGARLPPQVNVRRRCRDNFLLRPQKNMTSNGMYTRDESLLVGENLMSSDFPPS